MISEVELGLGRIDTALLYPPFLEEVTGVLAGLAPARYVATSGWRSIESQDAIYAIGRTSPGTIKTKVKGGWSYHNWGLALDFARDLNAASTALEPSWAADDLMPMARAAEATGKLQAGMFFKGFRDGPHVQLRLPRGVSLADLQGLSLSDAWRKLDGLYARI